MDWIDGSAVTTAALTLLGGDGDDELRGGSLADSINGGTGTDHILAGAGNDTVRLEDVTGDDIADGGTGTDLLSLRLDGQVTTAAMLAGLTGFEALVASLDNGRLVLPGAIANGLPVFRVDLLTGAVAATTTPLLEGGLVTGKLDIRGGAGGEILRGGAGADRLSDGGGRDLLWGRAGADTIALMADGAADTVQFVTEAQASRDIAGDGGLQAEADSIQGFFGAGDPNNVIQLVRSGFAGLGTKTTIALAGPGAAIDPASAALVIVSAADVVPGADFDNLAAINAAFGNRIAAGAATGTGVFLLAYGQGGTQAALYHYRDGDDVAGIGAADTLRLLAVIDAPASSFTAGDFVLA
jgi:Ca2+-binding RTX toxin-like protein